MSSQECHCHSCAFQSALSAFQVDMAECSGEPECQDAGWVPLGLEAELPWLELVISSIDSFMVAIGRFDHGWKLGWSTMVVNSMVGLTWQWNIPIFDGFFPLGLAVDFGQSADLVDTTISWHSEREGEHAPMQHAILFIL